jgi:AmmeMemoRadiSam system protein A
MPPLPTEARRFLLRLARQAIEAHLQGAQLADVSAELSGLPPAVREKSGVFISLHASGTLRGCIGVVEPRLPLYRAVVDTAVAAAARDPRFTPVTAVELPGIDLEISVASQPYLITADGIRIGTHGLLVTQGQARGVLLPQVASERNWSREQFLEETCRKAGLAPDAWRKGARLEAFEVEIFGEKMWDVC